jgi:hypothetical protein
MNKWGIDPENVKLIEYNLLANQGAEFTVGASEIENTKTYIAGSVADMQSLLVDVDENLPKDEDDRVKGEVISGRFVIESALIERREYGEK